MYMIVTRPDHLVPGLSDSDHSVNLTETYKLRLVPRLPYPREGQPGRLQLEEKLRVRSVDPRDIAWEVDTPAYRVYFWSLPPGPPPSGEGRMAWSSDEYEVEDADVSAVLEWANSEASPGQTFTLYAVVRCNGTLGLLRLGGVDPTKSSAQ